MLLKIQKHFCCYNYLVTNYFLITFTELLSVSELTFKI
ncbi:hypothetical protein SAMN05421825_0439 [Epilithonimonas hungarica]|uniref:Uncharacterized protein n=1 Tax=Epilithonimonas hungarica TaxID=454006 RepID=A0A1G7GEL1_9FLAO|nr:hypothetical protein SAMN05421825_0439 [Epilithonimonas hungarica]